MEMIESILQSEVIDIGYIFLYLHKGKWKAYARSARILADFIKEGKYTTEIFPSHEVCLETLTITSESFIENGLVDKCYTIEDNRIVLNVV